MFGVEPLVSASYPFECVSKDGCRRSRAESRFSYVNEAQKPTYDDQAVCYHITLKSLRVGAIPLSLSRLLAAGYRCKSCS